MIIIPILIVIGIIFAKIRNGLFAAFLILVATKSIMDAFWNIRLGPLSFSSIGGIIIPVLFFAVLKERKKFPKSWRLNVTFLIMALSLGLLFALPVKLIPTIEVIILNLNIFIGFFLIPSLITTKKRLKKFLIAIIVGGVFPIAVSLFQFQTGIIFHERETAGLTRYVGFYHDAFPVRFYGLMTILAVLMHLHFFKSKIVYKYLLYSIGFMALFSVYLVFSKAGVGIFGAWIALMLFFSKSKINQVLAIVFAISTLYLILGDEIYQNIEQLFSKETGYQAGEIEDARFTLAGRGYIWEDYWNFWAVEQSSFFQILGDGINRPAHNEFLRILLISGLVGLVFFVFFLIRILIQILKMNSRYRLFGLMLIVMFIVDCIGLMPGNYYFYNILVWGILGLVILNKSIE